MSRRFCAPIQTNNRELPHFHSRASARATCVADHNSSPRGDLIPRLLSSSGMARSEVGPAARISSMIGTKSAAGGLTGCTCRSGGEVGFFSQLSAGTITAESSTPRFCRLQRRLWRVPKSFSPVLGDRGQDVNSQAACLRENRPPRTRRRTPRGSKQRCVSLAP
jgi:hypothetical protein